MFKRSLDFMFTWFQYCLPVFLSYSSIIKILIVIHPLVNEHTSSPEKCRL